jgi:hypothetical protein
MTPEIRKQLQTTWTRQMARIANLVQLMEGELEKLRAKNISPEFIAKKSANINLMIEVVNTGDELITLQRNEIIRLRMENTILHDELTDSQKLDFIRKPSSELLLKIHETQKKPASN